MNTIPTLYTNYNELMLDMTVLGNVLSVPFQSLDEFRADLYKGFKKSKPMPTLEGRRYKLSNRVSDDYRINSTGEYVLADNESLVDLRADGSVDTDFYYEDLTPLLPEVQMQFTYEMDVNDEERHRLLDMIGIESDDTIGVFQGGVAQTEKLLGSVKQDDSLVFDDEDEIAFVDDNYNDYLDEENSGEAEQDSEDSDELDFDDYEDEDEDEQDDEDSDELDFDDYDEDERGDSEDSDELDFDDYAEDEQDSEENDEDEYSDDYYFDEDEYSDGEEEDDEQDSDALDFDDYEDENEYADDEEEDEDSDDYSDEAEQEDSEDSDELDFDDYDEDEQDSEDIVEHDYPNRGSYSNYFGENETGEQQEEAGVTVEPEQDDLGFIASNEAGVGIIDKEVFVSESESKTIEVVDDVLEGFEGYQVNIPVTPADIAVEKPSKPTAVDRSLEPTDLREFLRKHPRSEYSYVLQYFTKKQINDAIRKGTVIKKGNILRL